MVRDLIVDLIRLMVTTICLKFRKVADANVRYTNNRYSYTIRLGDQDGKSRLLRFESRQISHTFIYGSGFNREKTEYTYEVILAEYLDGELIFKEQDTFPQPCLKILNHTFYPHYCVIMAYIEIYSRRGGAQ